MSIDISKVSTLWYDPNEMVVGYKNKRWHEVNSQKELPENALYVEKVEIYHNVYYFYVDFSGQRYVVISLNAF